jgi:hypothetical protein
VPSTDHEAAGKQFAPNPSYPVEGKPQVDLIHGGHEQKIGLAPAHRLVVEAGAGEIQELGLVRDGQGVGLVDHRFALVPRSRPSAPDKNRSPW